MRNLNLILNKLYYRRLRQPDYHDDVREQTMNVLSSTFDHARDYRPLAVATHTTILRLCYPGLVTGLNTIVSGATHEDIDSGFSLDFATGQPLLHGWTVKGQLRSHFRDRTAAVAEIAGLPIETVKELEKEIFDEGDTFFDAVIFDGDDKGRFIGLDFFCRHRTDRPMRDTIPIRVLKLMPNVRLEFRFALRDGILTADEKLALFKELLMVFGVGARTNVGYGFLMEADNRILTPEMRIRVRCPHCGISNYKFHPNGAVRTKCYKCRKSFTEGGASDE